MGPSGTGRRNYGGTPQTEGKWLSIPRCYTTGESERGRAEMSGEGRRERRGEKRGEEKREKSEEKRGEEVEECGKVKDCRRLFE